MSGARGSTDFFYLDESGKMLWCADDFWRGRLKPEYRAGIKEFNENRLVSDENLRTEIQVVFETRSIPCHFFQDVSGWMWSVKEDGYLVLLKRNENLGWLMYTRKGKRLFPPESFLEGLL